MPRQDVVEYLRLNLKKYAPADLRRQLADEGVSDLEFDEALKAAMAASRRSKKSGALFLAGGALIVAGAALFLLNRPSAPPPPPDRPAAPESAFIGRYGYVVKLPPDYTAAASFEDQAKTVEVVHFCKAGTDPTNFVDQGLYGGLGIVRLEVAPNRLAGKPGGLEALMGRVTSRLSRNKERFHVKSIQVASLRGFEVTVEAPFPRLESFFLGEKVHYAFLAGQDDDIYRDIVTSLRETQAEN